MLVHVTELTDRMRLVLRLLLGSAQPVTGRRVAEALGMSPTTANQTLRALQDRGAVSAETAGNGVRWRAVTDSADASALTALTPAAGSGTETGSGARTSVPARPRRTVLALTALNLEFTAVQARLSDVREVRSHSGTRFVHGTFEGQLIDWSIYLAEVGPGNAGTASLVGQCVPEFTADMVAFAGIAGGLKPADQCVGDVVVADGVHDAHGGKHVSVEGESEFLSRAGGHSTPHVLVQLARAIARTDWNDGLLSTRRGGPQIHIGSIASTQAVVADRQSDLAKHIHHDINDAIAVDMESWGAYVGAHRHSVPALTVRGLSDRVDDKRTASDKKWQPISASNAATFFFLMLGAADPGDLPRRDPASFVPDGEPTHAIPDPVQPWLEALAQHDPLAAEQARADLAGRDGSLSTWVNTTLHRPRRWIRDDPTGLAWAVVGHVADLSESAKAADAHEAAAAAAERAGRAAATVAHRLWATLARIRRISETRRDDPTMLAEATSLLESIDLTTCPQMRPVLEFFTRRIDPAVPADVGLAAGALTALGHDPSGVGLARHAASDRVPGIDEVTARQLAGQVLVNLAIELVMEDNSYAARPIAHAARELLPYSPSTDLVVAQAAMGAAMSVDPSGKTVRDTAKVMLEVEQTALRVRNNRRRWGLSTPGALALAARARSAAGDPAGALRLLRPAPHGVADDTEARNDEVRQMAGLTALEVGDPELALELLADAADGTEITLARAAAFAQIDSMSIEAARLYRTVAEDQGVHTDQLTRAMLGLTYLGAPVETGAKDSVAGPLARLRAQDEQAADLVVARARLGAGRHRDALILARQYPASELAVRIQAQAMDRLGAHAEAVDLLDRTGRERGDDTLRAQAMMVGSAAALDDRVATIAADLASSDNAELRRVAGEQRVRLAEQAGDWAAVARHAAALAEDAEEASEHSTRYRWWSAHALFNMRRFDDALAVLWTPPEPISPTRAQEATLLFAIVRARFGEPGAPAADAEMFDWLQSIASSWLTDADVSAAAITTLIMLPLPDSLSDLQLARARRYQDDYFTRFEDVSPIKRITVNDDDISELVEHLKLTAPRAERLTELALQVWEGRAPAAMLADASGKGYAETLIYNPLRCRVVVNAGPTYGDEQQAACGALAPGRAVIDSSAVVLASVTRTKLTELTARFDRVEFPAALRDDLLGARNHFATKSAGSLGWNPSAGKPTMVEYTPEQIERWSQEANTAAAALPLLTVVPDSPDWTGHTWDAAVTAAIDAGTALWVDDVALRNYAAAQGVPAFGTLALLQALAADGTIDNPAVEQMLESYRANDVVDLPAPLSLRAAAAGEDFDPTGYTALQLSRPATWRSPESSFAQFGELLRAVASRAAGDQEREDAILPWVAAGAKGLVWASPAPARPGVLGGVLAWALLVAKSDVLADYQADRDAARLSTRLERLLDLGDAIAREACPDGDVVHHAMTVLADLLGQMPDPGRAPRVMASLLAGLRPELRERAWRAYLQADPASRLGIQRRVDPGTR